MTSYEIKDLFQCTGCHKELNFDSKTLPCFHSFCRSCLNKHFEKKTNGYGKCPECHEFMSHDHLRLSPFLAKSLRRRQLKTPVWKCEQCSENRIESIASYFCQDCKKIFCVKCKNLHKRLQPGHFQINLDKIARNEVIDIMVTDKCSLHKKEMGSHCEVCNLCFCDICYKNHRVDFPGCSPRPSYVREEALKRKEQYPTFFQEIDDLEMSLGWLNEQMTVFTEKLETDYNAKCQKLWLDYEKMIENAKRCTKDLCAELKRIMTDQVEKWRCLLEENDRILKRLEIWRLNLQYLLKYPQQDTDVVVGLRSLESKLSNLSQKSVRPKEEWQLTVTFPWWWLHVLEQLKSKIIGSVSLNVEKEPVKCLTMEDQWRFKIPKLHISSFHVSKEDGHMFFCDLISKSVMEYTEKGESVTLCQLSKGPNEFCPRDMCVILPKLIVVACGDENKIIFLERVKQAPYLKMNKIIHTQEKFYSVCEMDRRVLACSMRFQVDSFTTSGEKMYTVKPPELPDERSPLIRACTSTGKFWLSRMFSSEIFSFNSKGEKLQTLSTEEITYFCVSEHGDLYLCNKKGIFSSGNRFLCKFKHKSESSPRIFTSKKRICVCHKIDGEYLIKILEITY